MNDSRTRQSPYAPDQCKFILDTVGDLILGIDEEARISNANKALEQLLGYGTGTTVGKPVDSLLFPPCSSDNRSQCFTDAIKNAGASPSNYLGEFVARHQDGNSLPVDITMLNPPGAPPDNYYLIVRDLRRQKETRHKFQEQDELILQQREDLVRTDRLHIVSEMCTGIAHELNQPLTVISIQVGLSQQLAHNNQRDELLNSLAIINTQVQHATSILQDIGSLISKKKLPPSVTDLGQLIEKTHDLLRMDIYGNDIELFIEPCLSKAVVEVVEIQIQQVLLNLVRNAVDALHENDADDKYIHIITEKLNEHWVRVRVRDNGHGVVTAEQEKIFQRLYSSKDNGSGMGLSISRAIINEHGGTLDINKDYNQGAEFYFTLPLVDNTKGA